MAVVTKPQTFMFADDGVDSEQSAAAVPGLSRRHRSVRHARSGGGDREDLRRDTAGATCGATASIPYVHYHSMIHEALGIARGRARVRFGGAQGAGARSRARRRRGAAGRHRPSGPVGGARPDGDRRLSARPASTISAAAARPSTPARSRRSRPCRCPTPIRCYGADGPLACRCWRALTAGWQRDVRLALVLGLRAFDLRQCAPQGRALPRDRRADRGLRAGAGRARARLRLRRRACMPTWWRRSRPK